MDIQRRLVDDVSVRDGEDYDAVQKNWEESKDVKVSDWTGEGCEQDANANC